MKVYNYHPDTGSYLGEVEAPESPLEPGVYLIPAHATETAPPDGKEGYDRRFIDGAWGYLKIEEPLDTPTTPQPTDSEVLAALIATLAEKGIIP